jgi:hypothetical protein
VSSSTSSAVVNGRWPSNSRTPTVTATSAVHSVAPNSSTNPDRNAVRSTFIVAAR